MKVQYQITEEDYAKAARLHAWRRFIARPSFALLVAGGVILVLLGMSAWMLPSGTLLLAFMVVVFGMLIAFNLLVQTPRSARRQYRQYKGIQQPITVELTEGGVKFSSADGEGILRWSKVLQWRQDDRFILIYAMPILFYIVPKSTERQGFDIQLLLRRLVENVGPER